MIVTPAGFEPGHIAPDRLGENALAFVFREDKLLGASSMAPLPTLRAVRDLGVEAAPQYLGRYDGVDCVAIRAPSDVGDFPGWQWAGLRSLFDRLPDALVALAGRAYQIVEWDRSHQFCGRCSSPMENRVDERSRQCRACGHVAYPRVSPAMMVLVTRGRELLLARTQRFLPGVYSALAGFVEAGESLEDCVHREVREEVSIEVAELRYVASQSWPFPHSLMVAFTAEYRSGDPHPGDAEIEDVRWFALDVLPKLPTRLSIARHLIETTITRLST